MFEWIIGIYLLLRAYHQLYFFILRRRIRGPIKLIKNAKPFSFRKGKKVVLMIHGFTSSPGEFRRLGNYLARNNISVHAPLLPGHGTSPERLALIKYFEWIEFLDREIALLEQEYEEIYLLGNSMGGNLALILANKSKKIKGIVLLGTPIFFHHEKKRKYILLPVLRRIKLFQKKRYKTDYEERLAKEKRGTYSSIPLRSLVQLIKIVNLSKKSLPEVKEPILIVQAKDDPISKIESVEYIERNVKSRNKKSIVLPLNYHFILHDEHGSNINKEILKFLKSN